MIPWLQERGEQIDACLVGEPTNPEHMGDMIKIGRRGSLNGILNITGKAGHVAYPERAINPVPVMIDIAQKLNKIPLDQGDKRFQPSHLEITSIDVGNPTTNVIPPMVTLKFNIRFNPHFSGAQLETYVREYLSAAFLMHEQNYQAWHLDINISGEAFITQNEQLQIQLGQAVEHISGKKPDMSTSGGTSDARVM
jgi:succinyl-diaminopimelate desuccinylase